MSSPVLDGVGIERWFGDFDVFGSLNLQLEAGGSLALTGPNGSGKSTLLRCVCGIDSPTKGAIKIAGEIVDERSPTIRSKLASVMDDLDFFPDLSVVEHLDLLARAHRMDDPEHIVDQALADVGLTRQAAQLPGTLSTGQKRRLALATAFVRPRQLLVLDEPEQRLDESGLSWLVHRLNAEKTAGLSVVFASHDPALVAAIADATLSLGDT